MTLVILAAGMGSRYGGIKQIDPITENGEFIIDFTVYDAIQAGFDKVVIVIKEENLELFKSTVGARIEGHINVEYAFQRSDDLPEGYTIPEGRIKPWGTGQAVLSARHLVNDSFAVVNADDFYGRDAFLKLAKHFSSVNTSDDTAHFCIVGYVLEDTLTENGSVSRGQCEINSEGYLTGITERTKIVRGDGVAMFEENGEWTDIPLDTVVSMNCFGLTPAAFSHFEQDFVRFMAEKGTELKSEFYLPSAVFSMIEDKSADVKVLNTDAAWFGVTYHEDKPRVIEAIRDLIDAGVYPKSLWQK